LYGDAPYSVAVVHGGPGACGTMAPVARGLEKDFGILEPMQTKDTIDGLIEELKEQLEPYTSPFVLIGHSWGGWLVWLFAAKYPKLVKHIILIGSGPFEEEYAKDIMSRRMENLSEGERILTQNLFAKFGSGTATKEESSQLGGLMEKTDTYCKIDGLINEEAFEADEAAFSKIWPEAAELRRNGNLLKAVDNITCPITFMHGKYDPHPYEGIQDVLNEYGVDFEFILMDKCGHTPWIEKFYAESFFKMLHVLVSE
jgi:pimeloyl-ACP methyl ester carboxylesterase